MINSYYNKYLSKCVFMFKQTTAYDMRISDWSSDMCSSDLNDLFRGWRTFWSINRHAWPKAAHASMPPPLAELESGRSYVAEIFNGTPHPHPMHLHGHTFRVLGSSARTLPPHWEIGRASCRERVCQYV